MLLSAILLLLLLTAQHLPSASCLSVPSSAVAGAASASSRSSSSTQQQRRQRPSSPPIRRVAIIGAGIAGLSLGHALQNSPEGCAAQYLDAAAVIGGGEDGPTAATTTASASSPPTPSPFGISVSTFDSRPSLDVTAGAGVQLNGGMSVLYRINPALHGAVVDAALPLTAIRSRSKPWSNTAAAADDGNEKDPSSYSTLLEIELEDTIKRAGGQVEEQLMLDGTVQAYTVMRGALHEALLEGLPQQARDGMHFGKTLVDIVPTTSPSSSTAGGDVSDDEGSDGKDGGGGGGVMCHFSDGSTYGPYDVVVGCDGIKSAVKEYVERGRISADPESREGRSSRSAIYSGIRIKFAVQDGGKEEEPDSSSEERTTAELRQYFGDGMYGLAGVYGNGVGRKPTRCSYIILRDEDYIGPFRRKRRGDDDDDKFREASTQTEGEVEGGVVSENADWTQDTRTGSREECRALMAKAGIPTLDLGPVVDGSDRFFEVGVYFHNPFSFAGWSRKVRDGNGAFCVLAGDAAHAMPPFLGQGANQAIQDAYCLATKIFEHNANWVEYESSLLSAAAATEAAATPLYSGGEEEDETDAREEVVADRSLRALLKEYERVRWPATTSITVKAAFLGYLECGGEGFLSKFRDVFFKTLGKVGVASKVFLDAAMPRV